MTTFTKTNLTVGVALALGLASLSARAAIGTFTINETLLGAGSFSNVQADKLNGGYREVITFTPSGNPAVLNFDTVAFAQFGQLEDVNGLVDSDLNVEYRLYALFESSGTVNAVGNPVFTGTSGSFRLFLDLNENTTGTLPGSGSGSITLNNNADDLELAFSNTLIAGIGQIVPVPAFDLTFGNFTLTANGENYFIEPDPFYLVTVVDGDFDEFPVAPGTLNLRGDVSAVFEVPEPGTLSLIGMSLVGFASARRRKKA